MNSSKTKLLFATLCLGSSLWQKSTAQLVSGDVFLQGNHVEVGIAPNGAFGSGGNAPSGYHPRGSSGIGFVADPAKDGWTTGTPTYFGDYFLPGTPQEGWDISIDGISHSAWRGLGSTSMTGSLTGNNTGYATIGSKKTGTWKGNVGDLEITQTTSLQSNKLYFVVNVEFYNSGTTTLRNIYYNRSVDPDNEQTLTGSFTTKNKIVFKLPGSPSNKTLVTGVGLDYPNAYLGLGTKDCRAKPYIIPSSLYPVTDLEDLYEGSGSASGFLYDTTSFTNDVGIGIVFKLDSLPAGKSTSVAFAYILREIDLDSAFLDITPRWRYRDVSYNSGDTIYPCKGSVIDLRIENAGYYDSWSWTPTSGLSDPGAATNTVNVGTTGISYTASGSSSFCPGSSISATIHLMPVDGPVAPTVSSPVLICKGVATTALTASPSAGLKWYTSATGLSPLPSAPIPGSAVEDTISYFVSTDNGSCEGPRSKIDVIVAKYPKPSFSSPQKLCVGDGLVPLSGVVGTNLKWYTSATGGTGSTTAPTIATSTTDTVTYYVSQSSGVPGCESDRALITAIVFNRPDVVMTLDGLLPKATYCFRTGMVLKAESSVAASSFKWYNNGSLIGAATADTMIPWVEGEYSVLVRDTNGCKDSTFVTVYRDTLLRPTLSPRDIFLCPGNIVRLYCSPSSSSYSFTWYKDGLDFTTTKPSEADAKDEGEYVVKVTEIGGCEFLTNRVRVNHYPVAPKPKIIPGPGSLQVSSPFARYQWYRNNKIISGATMRLYNYAFAGQYYAQVWDANECTQFTDTVDTQSLSIKGYTNSVELLKVYPNPTKDQLFIECSFSPIMRISDMSGRTIRTAKGVYTINLSDLASGLYLLHIADEENPERQYTMKIEKASE